jgi:hypothetical protein
VAAGRRKISIGVLTTEDADLARPQEVSLAEARAVPPSSRVLAIGPDALTIWKSLTADASVTHSEAMPCQTGIHPVSPAVGTRAALPVTYRLVRPRTRNRTAEPGEVSSG